MRFIFSLLIWLIIVGGLWAYTSYRDSAIPPAASTVPLVDHTVDERVTIELTPTFDLEEDPFALRTEDQPSASIELKLNGRPVALPKEPVRHGMALRMDGIAGLLTGHNEVFVQASPPLAESGLEHGVRVKILTTHGVIGDRTVWSSGGALVSGSFGFTYQPGKEEAHDQ